MRVFESFQNSLLQLHSGDGVIVILLLRLFIFKHVSMTDKAPVKTG